MAKLRQPRRAGAAAARGGIGLAVQVDGFGGQPFEAVPETHWVENRIQRIRDGAVMAVLRVSVMPPVMFTGLNSRMSCKNEIKRPFSLRVRCSHL